MATDMNKDFFKTWTPDSAYIAGFVMADGYIMHKDYSKCHGYSLCVRLNTKDKCVLEYIRDNIYPTKVIHDYVFDSHRDGVPRYVSDLRISSKMLIEDMMKINIIPRKTGKEKLPEIDNENFRHYLRGYFDGDGCIINTKRIRGKYTSYTTAMKLACANNEFLKDIQDRCNNVGHIYSHTSRNCHYWNIYDKKDIEYFYNFIYLDDKQFCLLRKRNIFESILNRTETKNGS